MQSGLYPVFWFGKDKTSTASGSVADDQTVFEGVGHSFLEGEGLFISQSDDTGNQWLGPILDVDGDDVTSTWPTAGAKGSGAKLWTAPASQIVVFSQGAAGGYSPSGQHAVELDVTPAGTAIATALGGEPEFFSLSFGPAAQADWLAWKTFRREERRNGLDTFSIALQDWERGSVPTIDEVRYWQQTSGAKFGKSANYSSFELLFYRVRRDTVVLD